jgi:D-glycerate 3-kinase
VELFELVAERVVEFVELEKLRREVVVVGLCGVPGCGVSALRAAIRRRARKGGLKVVSLSLDDFSLTAEEREAIARIIHPLCKTRGVPGTHDIDLARAVLDGLRDRRRVALPMFDRRRDVRRPVDEWPFVEGPVDLIVLQGWCVGAVPESDCKLARPINTLEQNEDPNGVWRRHANRVLGDSYQKLFREMDLLLMVTAPSFAAICRWRKQEETWLRRAAARKHIHVSQLMSSRQIDRALSQYERLTRHILAEMPRRADVVVESN